MKKNLLIICTILFTLNLTATAQVVVPVNGVPPVITPVTINASPGDDNNPQVSGDWTVYASDFSIRYYNFATGIDAEIPRGLSARDLLSDISGSKIVFSRIIAGVKTAVMVFDAATPAVPPIEIDAAPATTRLGSAIGGDTIAYIDFGLQANGELVIHNLTDATSIRITNDIIPDQSPSVSPDGSVVVWEHCNSSLSNCDIWQAVKSGAVWNVGIVSNSPNAEANPDTNGTLVVYDSFRSGNSDIFWRTVVGGSEVQLQTPGFDGSPSIVGNFISFESRPTLGATTDIFVYDIANNLLYRITDTPLVTEQLNDITLLPNGDLRVVWASDEDGFSSRNIKGATFSLPQFLDTVPPVFAQPANIIANAVMPSGAVINYTIQATDNIGVVSLICLLPSGSVFPIGTTAVQCTASDAAGNSAVANFTVRIKGAPEQIVDLSKFVNTSTLPPNVKANLLIVLYFTLINHRNTPLACSALGIFIQYVQAQPASLIPPTTKAQLIADATRIKAVLGCF